MFMEKQTFKKIMNDPFSSTALKQLNNSGLIMQKFPNQISIEELSKSKYQSTDRIDELYLINKSKGIFHDTFFYISEDSFRDFDIAVQSDIKKL